MLAKLIHGKAIYLWLGMEGVDEPRAYVLPWSQEMAKQLNGAQREAQQTGTSVLMQKPFENSLDNRDRQFYAAPVPPPPEKEKTQQNVHRFEHSDTSSNNNGD